MSVMGIFRQLTADSPHSAASGNEYNEECDNESAAYGTSVLRVRMSNRNCDLLEHFSPRTATTP